VLINLVGNAIKFTHAGEIFVSVYLLKIENNQLTLAFEVKDTGLVFLPKKLRGFLKLFHR
jgi:signal transduction histidine kinase